jgi:hypothetical protein
MEMRVVLEAPKRPQAPDLSPNREFFDKIIASDLPLLGYGWRLVSGRGGLSRRSLGEVGPCRALTGPVA